MTLLYHLHATDLQSDYQVSEANIVFSSIFSLRIYKLCMSSSHLCTKHHLVGIILGPPADRAKKRGSIEKKEILERPRRSSLNLCGRVAAGRPSLMPILSCSALLYCLGSHMPLSLCIQKLHFIMLNCITLQYLVLCAMY